jgi:peptidyl-prolyl cis-trans isomerase B (cyclophilin B)
MNTIRSLNRLFFNTLLFATTLMFVSACAAQESATKPAAGPTTKSTESKSTDKRNHPMVKLHTNHGIITLELDAEKAPLTVANFLDYAKSGFFDGTIFHRVISNFMIQGGGFEPGMKQKTTKATIQNEAGNGLKNDNYTVAMARTGDPHSATAQFFINVKNNDFLNYTAPNPQGYGYAVFGKVVEGKEVVDKIKGVKTAQRGGHGDVPLEDVIITRVEVL